jgi:hypothetical protein
MCLARATLWDYIGLAYYGTNINFFFPSPYINLTTLDECVYYRVKITKSLQASCQGYSLGCEQLILRASTNQGYRVVCALVDSLKYLCIFVLLAEDILLR